ncbi:hypothetical protein GK108_13080 [Spirosoma terrae]|uniref:Uncharacterized protein n=1 Tax=Spirosoma terrae TaxID=1968276 RepID=A0A6L9L5Y4_9BACT|nr:hypothetical protein [Spirosoma terrae]
MVRVVTSRPDGLASNRTVVELKYGKAYRENQGRLTSNRTVVELKSKLITSWASPTFSF